MLIIKLRNAVIAAFFLLLPCSPPFYQPSFHLARSQINEEEEEIVFDRRILHFLFFILYFVFCICIHRLWDANSGTNGAPLIGVQLMQSICCWLHEYFDCKHHLHDYYRQKHIKKYIEIQTQTLIQIQMQL